MQLRPLCAGGMMTDAALRDDRRLGDAANKGEAGLSAGALSHPAFKPLRAAAMAYPQTTEDFPWGHPAYKVAGKKAFLFMGAYEKGALSVSMKLPYRNHQALTLKGAKPTDYGLGRSGWVTFTYSAKAKPPMTKLLDYLDESWRAVAPKRLSATHPPPMLKRPRR
jgi:predicted DNA-binding protein (MmcQ/YjbR family)